MATAKEYLQQAMWIWTNEPHGTNTYVDFCVSVTVKEAVMPVFLALSVDGNYAVYCNGTFVNSGQYPDYPVYKVYDELPLPVKSGENRILIRVYWPGEDHFSYRKEAPGLLYAVYTQSGLLQKSEAGVPCGIQNAFAGDVPKLTGQLGYSFCYDAKKVKETVFAPAVCVQKQVTLYARPIKKLEIGERLPVTVRNTGVFWERPYETLGQRMQNAAMAAKYCQPYALCRPVTLPNTDGADGIYVILDMGREEVGFLDLELDLPQNALVLGGYGEHLEDLRVRSYVGSRNFAFTYAGVQGKNHFFMPLRRLGLRYLQLHIYAKEVTLHYAGIRPTTYPLASYLLPVKDRLHRKILETCERTLRCCMHDHYEDTPWREQGLYTMDSRNEMLCTYDVFHETAFPKACLRMIGLGVREDGFAELCSPARANITIPSFSAIYIVQLEEYLSHTGDLAFLREMLPYARKIVESFATHIDKNTGLLAAYTDKQYWNFYEWQEGLEGNHNQAITIPTFDAPLCAFVSLAFQSAARIFTALGETEDAQKFSALAEALNGKMDAAFWNGTYYHTFMDCKTGTLSHGCQLTQALFICCGACTGERLNAVRELLKEDRLLPITLSYSIFKYTAIMTDPANKQWMLDDIADIWGKMLFAGATTFWETADGAPAFDNAGSLCHGWSAVPLHLYYRYGL